MGVVCVGHGLGPPTLPTFQACAAVTGVVGCSTTLMIFRKTSSIWRLLL